ncbi:putative membrane protein, TIGR04086 family [Sporobacter termitidis DSM 10068]|uniref:Putative membrane protein, TIGR04086 family n=1 Tax=Sporobacter termitidis DSM 10068 TaxID=1123282 RepID=A0A1M5TF99_9FIRM|nr:TIGR04086 family membrane protein [Sporobacter termitidis]SHH49389.1 putative membrane protein, TIGR04086 family [Sporobacter termitidis DSM 10068]
MHKNDDKKGLGRGFAVSVLLGTAIGFLLTFIVFAIFASVVASGKISEDLMRHITVGASFVGALIGAVVAVKRHRAKIITVGLTVGALMFLLTFVGALFSGGPGGRLTPSLLVAFIAGGIIGGLVNLKRKKHKHAS